MVERKGPIASATNFIPGTRKKGNDGEYWIVKQDINGRHRWAKEKVMPKSTKGAKNTSKDITKKVKSVTKKVNQAHCGKYQANGEYILGKKLGSILLGEKGIALQTTKLLSFYDHGAIKFDERFNTLVGKSPAKYGGKRALNKKDNKIYFSDGTTWSEVTPMEKFPTAFDYLRIPQNKLKYDIDEVICGLITVADALKKVPVFVVLVGWKYIYNFVDNLEDVVSWTVGADKRFPGGISNKDPKIPLNERVLFHTSWISTSELKMTLSQESGILHIFHNILPEHLAMFNKEMKKVFGVRYIYRGPSEIIEIKLKKL